MAKAKKPARKAPKEKPRQAEPAATTPGRKFAVVRAVTLPTLALKIEEPVYVTFRKRRQAADADGLSMVEVLEVESGTVMELEVPAKLRAAFEANYPGEEMDGKSFCIVRHEAHARKNKYGYTIEEIDPTKPAN